MLAPLFVKYRTESGQGYLYDLGTGHIIEVDDVIHELVDDYRVLSPEELFQKYAHLAPEAIETALQNLDELRQDGMLADHAPNELCKIEKIRFENKFHQLEDFWKNNASLLILGLTEKCNLSCSYCCYSGHFIGQRSHSNRTMPQDFAEKAIDDYLRDDSAHGTSRLTAEQKLQPPTGGFYPVTFYGGEPLLEWELLKHLVRFGENKAAAQDKTIRWAITTNGTLLDDDVCDFLVEHGFMVMVSCDGPKFPHDRYRVFPSGAGSFDLVYGNLDRFAKRHPGYMNRGISATLAPPLELDETRKLIETFFPEYPLSRASLVDTGIESRFADHVEPPTRYGCFTACETVSEPPNEAFRDFGEQDRVKLTALRKECIASVKEHGIWKTKQILPFHAMLFEQNLDLYHRRSTSEKKSPYPILVPCLPGFTRRFCDVEGNYLICERIDNSSTFILGNVQTGLDYAKLEHVMELRRHFGDCANCSAQRTCDICYARIPNTDEDASGYDPLFDLQCQRTRLASVEQLQTYTEIMEANPTAFDKPGGSGPPTRLATMRYCVHKLPLSPETLEKLQCEML